MSSGPEIVACFLDWRKETRKMANATHFITGGSSSSQKEQDTKIILHASMPKKVR